MYYKDVSRIIESVFKLSLFYSNTLIYDPDVILNYMTALSGNQYLDVSNEKTSHLVMFIEWPESPDIRCPEGQLLSLIFDMYTFYISTMYQ